MAPVQSIKVRDAAKRILYILSKPGAWTRWQMHRFRPNTPAKVVRDCQARGYMGVHTRAPLKYSCFCLMGAESRAAHDLKLNLQERMLLSKDIDDVLYASPAN